MTKGNIYRLLHRSGFHGLRSVVVIPAFPKQADYPAALHIQKRGDEVLILDKKQFSDVESFYGYLESRSNLPIILWVNGGGAVEKEVAAETKDLIAAVLGVSTDSTKDFIWQVLPAGSKKQVSIIRKDQLEKALQEVPGLGQRLVYVFLSKEGIIDLRGIDLEADFLPLYRAGVHFYLTAGADIYNLPLLDTVRPKIKKQSLAIKGLMAAASLLMFLTLSGFLAYGLLQNHITHLQAQLQAQAPLVKTLAAQDREIKVHRALLSQSESEKLRPTRLSLYLDRIAEVAGEGLIFNSFIYRPDEKQLKKIALSLLDHPPDMLITGEALSAGAISGLTQAVDQLDFTTHTELLESSYDFGSSSHFFTLIIRLNE